jgi:hypothetical protein
MDVAHEGETPHFAIDAGASLPGNLQFAVRLAGNRQSKYWRQSNEMS